MSLISIDIIDSCFKKTKEFLFPIKKIVWLKLGLVVLLAEGFSLKSSNFNFSNNFSNLSELGQIILNNLQWILWGWFFLFLLSFIFVFIEVIFDFVLLDSVNNKNCMIKKSLSRTNKKAISYFLFKCLINLIFSFLFITLAIPLLIRLFSVLDEPLQILSFTYFWISIPLFMIIGIFSSIINSIIFNLMMPDMYFNQINSFKSWKKIKILFFRKIREIIMYWIVRFLFGLIGGVISLLIFLFLFLIFILIGLMIFGLGFLISLFVKILMIPLIILGITFGIFLFLLMIYSFIVILVPIRVFFTNYRLEFYKKIIK
jgi:hypothetical protein